MSIDKKIKDSLKAMEETVAEEVGCTKMIAAGLELGAPKLAAEQLGPFQLQQCIGSGGMGEVWKAHHSKLNRTFAVKRLKPEVIFNDELKLRFEREMQIAGNLDHPFIVRITHADEIDGTHFLAMDFVAGESLFDIGNQLASEGKQFSVEDVCGYGAEIAEAMGYAHEQGVVHRDLKPANIMLASDGHVRVLDMGLARLSSPDHAPSELTSHQQLMGTPDYMPPEQVLDSRKADERSDIYALGATLYKLLTGNAPFVAASGATIQERLQSILHDHHTPVKDVRSDVPAKVSALIDAMLQKDASSRPQSMQQVAETLRECAGTQSPKASKAAQPPRRTTPIGKWIAAAASLPLLIIAGVLSLQKITLKDPVYGNITITAPEDVKVVFSRIDEPAPEQEFIANGKQFQLKRGSWDIRIAGDFKDYAVKGSSRIEVTDAKDRVIEIVSTTRQPLLPSIESSTTKKPPEPIPSTSGDRPNDEELLARLESVDWSTSGPTEGTAPGLAVAHAAVPGVPNVQITTRVPTASEVHSVSPSGRYLVVSMHSGADMRPLNRILERDTGRLVGVIPAILNDGLGWNKDETELYCGHSDGRGLSIAVFSVNGSYQRGWYVPAALRAESSPDGSRIIYFPMSPDGRITMTDAFGGPVEDFVTPEKLPPNWKHAHQAFSPSGRKFAVSYEDQKEKTAQVVVYGLNGGDPLFTVAVEEPWFAWHPLEDKFHCGTSVYSRDGSRQECNGMKPGYVESFSPDGRHIVSTSGQLFRSDGTFVRNIDTLGSKPVTFWKDDSTIVMLPRLSPGHFREVSLTGRVLRESFPPIPLPVRFMSEQASDTGFVSFVPTEAGGERSWVHIWSPAGRGTSQSLPGRGKHSRSDDVCIDPANKRFAWRASYVSDQPWKIFGFDGQEQTEFRIPDSAFDDGCWSPDGTQFAAREADRLIHVCSATDTQTFELPVLEAKPVWIQWLSNTELLVSHYRHEGRRHFDTRIDLESGTVSSDLGDATQQTIFKDTSPSGIRSLHFDSKSQRFWCEVNSTEGQESKTIEIEFPSGPPAYESMFAHWSRDESKVILCCNIWPDYSTWLFDFESGDLRSGPVSAGVKDVIWRDGFAVTCDFDQLNIIDSNTGIAKRVMFPSERHTLCFPKSTQAESESDRQFFMALLNKRQEGDLKESPDDIVGGNPCLVDARSGEVVWMGVPFSDGTRAVIEPSGRIREVAESDFDQYLTYVVRYECGSSWNHPRLIPLSRLQFASRIGLTESQQVLQKILDLGGALLVGHDFQRVTSDEIKDARALPQVEDVVGVVLDGNRYVRAEDLEELTALPNLKTLILNHLEWLDSGDLKWLKSMNDLTYIGLSNTQVNDSLSASLPETIQGLGLENTNISEYLLNDLVLMPKLRKLELGGVAISEEAKAAFAEKCPNCEVNWVLPDGPWIPE